MGKLFTRRAATEKFLRPRAALIGRAKKKVHTSSDVLFFPLKQKKVFGLIHGRSSYFCKRPRAVVSPALNQSILIALDYEITISAPNSFVYKKNVFVEIISIFECIV